MSLNYFKSSTIAFSLGLLLSLSFAPYNIWIAQIVSIAGFFFLVDKMKSSKFVFFTSLIYFIGVYTGGINWVYELSNNGANIEISKWLISILILYVSIIFAIVIAIYHYYFRLSLLKYLYFSFAWFVFEIIKGNMFGGTPWLNIGSIHVDTILKNYMPVVGEYGVTYIGVLLSALLANIWIKKWNIIIILFILLIAVGLGQVKWVNVIKNNVSVSLVQTNLTDDKKWNSTIISESINKYKMIAQEAKTNLIILPETAFPLSLDQISAEVGEIHHILKSKSTTMISGITVVDDSSPELRREYSSAIALGISYGINHKKQMIPFYEYIPTNKTIQGWIGLKEQSGLISYEGEQKNINILIDDQNYEIATTICYEIAYGDIISDKSISSNLIVLISNVASFGNTAAQYQQFRIAQVRALENQKFVAVSGNTGVTGIIDNNGQIIKILPVWTEGILMGNVNMLEGKTLFNKVGNSIIWCLMLFIVFFHLMLFLYKNRFFKNKSD
jgi:apolipoprotein N-acyltransferase